MMDGDGERRRREDAPVQPAGQHRQHGEEIHVQVGLVGMPGEGIDQQHDLADERDAGDLARDPADPVDAPGERAQDRQRRAHRGEIGRGRPAGWRPDQEQPDIDPQDRDQQPGESRAEPLDFTHLRGSWPGGCRIAPANRR